MGARRRDRRRLAARPAGLPELRGRHVGAAERRRSAPPRRPLAGGGIDARRSSATGASRAAASARAARLRRTAEAAAEPAHERDDAPRLGAAAVGRRGARRRSPGSAERHPSRTILLLPDPTRRGPDRRRRRRSKCFAIAGSSREVCSEVVELRLRRQARAGARRAIVEPLLDLRPARLPAAGAALPPWGDAGARAARRRRRPAHRRLDRVGRPAVRRTGSSPQLFDRIAVSDIAWARTSRWRALLASLWPGIADGEARSRVTGPKARGAPARRLAALAARRDDDRARARRAAEQLERIALDGEPVAAAARRPAAAERPALRRARPLRPRPDLRGRAVSSQLADGRARPFDETGVVGAAAAPPRR